MTTTTPDRAARPAGGPRPYRLRCPECRVISWEVFPGRSEVIYLVEVHNQLHHRGHPVAWALPTSVVPAGASGAGDPAE